MINLLSIAGSDSSGGAGIQGDLKTFAAHKAHGLSVVTAITAQNTVEVLSVETVNNVEDQLWALEKDIAVHGIKIGMLYSKKNVLEVAAYLERNREIPVVFDPLLYASTGKELVTEEAKQVIKSQLISQVTLITPNTFEGSNLANIHIETLEDREAACKIIYDTYQVKILLKGGHNRGKDAVDIFYDGNHFKYYRAERIDAKNTHGTGCCLSSAIIYGLASGKTMEQAIADGKEFITRAILNGYSIGQGQGPVDPLLHQIKR